MTVPQIIYVIAVLIYVFFFFLFLRFFFWKAYADFNFWRRKPYLDTESLAALARRKGRPLPFLSILVPARNEADVIDKTIEHMSAMNYPAEKYEVLIATDEKETQMRDEKLPGWVRQAGEFFGGQIERPKLAPQARTLVLGLLAAQCIALCEHGIRPSLRACNASLLSASKAKIQMIVREMAEIIILSGERLPSAKLDLLHRRHFRAQRASIAQESYAIYLSLAALVSLSFWMLSGESMSRERVRNWRKAWNAFRDSDNRPVPDMVQHLLEMAAGKVSSELASRASEEGLEAALGHVARECLPTTQDIVEERLKTPSQRGMPSLKHIIVPFDFDGKVGGSRTGWPVPSTKGRALNYALGFLDPRSEMCGFYDAESRPDPDVLLYIAFRRLGDGDRVSLFQGPVFQVRNFYQMGPFCKIASLYQAIAHDWYMPALFKRLPFVGGTNLWVATALIKDIGGYDHSALTEDLELGARAYLLRGVWPEYLPYYSSEQTPPTFNAFFRQRLRWGTGHLQVMDKIRLENGYPVDRKRPLLKQLFIKGQVEWVVYQSATFVPPLVLALWWRGWVDPHILPNTIRWVLNGFSATYIAFTIYAYYRYMPYLDTWSRPDTLMGRALVVLQLFFLPMAAFFFPVPYSSAMVLKALNKHPKSWTKTPRTKE